MHKYLRTIGFSKYSSNPEVRELLDRIQEHYASDMLKIELNGGDALWEIRAELGEGLGIVLGGYIDRAGKAVREHYFPYFLSKKISSDVYCSIQRHVENDSYSGMLDDMRVGISLIFHLTNGGDYMLRRAKQCSTGVRGVCLSGFSRNGKILLPIYKNERQRALSKIADHVRGELIEAARNGDERAMESLSNQDMDTYSAVSRRMLKEDIYSIVDSCFMPEGIQCELYSVIGDIREIGERKNLLTGEEICDFLIQANEVLLRVCINKADLQGEPEIGRRFKGSIWLQGEALWEEQSAP